MAAAAAAQAGAECEERVVDEARAAVHDVFGEAGPGGKSAFELYEAFATAGLAKVQKLAGVTDGDPHVAQAAMMWMRGVGGVMRSIDAFSADLVACDGGQWLSSGGHGGRGHLRPSRRRRGPRRGQSIVGRNAGHSPPSASAAHRHSPTESPSPPHARCSSSVFLHSGRSARRTPLSFRPVRPTSQPRQSPSPRAAPPSLRGEGCS